VKTLLFLKNILFDHDAPEERRLPVWAKYAIPLVLFGIIRIATAHALDYRQVHYDDDTGYVAGAMYILEHGHVSTEHSQLYRQFPGLSLLILVVNAVVGNWVLSGYVVVIVSALIAICLVQFLFDDFRLTVIFTFFFPWWITTSSAVFGTIGRCLFFALFLGHARGKTVVGVVLLGSSGRRVQLGHPATCDVFHPAIRGGLRLGTSARRRGPRRGGGGIGHGAYGDLFDLELDNHSRAFSPGETAA